MQLSTRRFLHDIVAEVLGLPKSKVIWSNQDGVKLAPPFVTLRAYSHQAEAMRELLPTADSPGVITHKTPTAFVLEVRYFGTKGNYPVDIVDDFVRCLDKVSIVDKFFINGVAFLYADPVQDITSLLGNNQQYEPVAAVDLHCRFTGSITDDVGYIEQVDINGVQSEQSSKEEPQDIDIDVDGSTGGEEPDPGVLPTGSQLIYGTITSDGRVKDLDHAIPIDISIDMD